MSSSCDHGKSLGSGLLRCQLDSYATEGYSTVVACTKDEQAGSNMYHVTLDDSVFYPEGGGQPWDLGTVDGIAIEKVIKSPASDKHIVVDIPTALEVGSSVHCKIDWGRRYDFMQQHTAQVIMVVLYSLSLREKN